MFSKETQYWFYICVLESMRQSKITNTNLTVFEIVDLVPLGIVRKSIELDNPFDICEWVIKEHFKAEFKFMCKIKE